MAEFLMPKLGADMTAGKLVAWRKKLGDPVRRGDIVAEVETDKGIIDVESFQTGVLTKYLIEPGQMAPVGTPLAIIQGDGETQAVQFAAAEATPAIARAAALPLTAAVSTATVRVAISPAARRLARELGVDSSTVKGTGPHGAISLDDIRAAVKGPAAPTRPVVAQAPPPPAVASSATIDRAAAMRQAIAAAMSRSKREIPHYYLSTTIDLDRTVTWVAEQNQRLPIAERLLYGAVLLKATALALRELPEFNSSFQDGRVVENPQVHIGVAISLRQGGLIAPAIHDTAELSVTDVMRKLKDLVQRARTGALRSSELSDPTITVTSLGEQGVESLYPVIYPPQTAIVGFGKVVVRPWVVDGQVVPRQVITATLAADHRVTDGHRGARFLAKMDELLQEPEKL